MRPAGAYEPVQKHKVTPGIPGWLNKNLSRYEQKPIKYTQYSSASSFKFSKNNTLNQNSYQLIGPWKIWKSF